MATGDLLSLKRRWLPLFVIGVALFGAGLTLFLLWLYRSSPGAVRIVVGMLTTPSGDVPPRGTLVSLAAALLTLSGGLALVVAVRRITASEIGEIDSFWWKVAVAALAGRWWLGEPRVVVVSGEIESSLPLIRALKGFTGRIAVVVPLVTPRELLAETLVALAENEVGVRGLIESLAASGAAFDAPALSAALRLRGRLEVASAAPRLADAIARADAIVFSPNPIGDGLPEELADSLRHSRGKKIAVPPITAGAELAPDLRPIAKLAGQLDAVLINSNTVPPLVEGRHYVTPQEVSGVARSLVARDVVDWGNPMRHDPSKLAVFLREVIQRD